MNPLAWVPVVLFGSLFAALPFLFLRALVYLAYRLIQSMVGQSDAESAALFSRRFSAVLCALLGIVAVVVMGSKSLEGGIVTGITLFLAGCITLAPAVSSDPMRRNRQEEVPGIERTS